jgi:hypothetical protein
MTGNTSVQACGGFTDRPTAPARTATLKILFKCLCRVHGVPELQIMRMGLRAASIAEIFGEQGVSNAASARQAEDRRLRLARSQFGGRAPKFAVNRTTSEAAYRYLSGGKIS